MESTTINNAIKEVRELFNEIRSNLSREETKRIRSKLHSNKADYNFLEEKEQKDSLTTEENKVLKNIDRYLKNISMHLKNLKKHFKKYKHGIDCLFNEHNEEDYTSNNSIKAINNVRTLLNELRSDLSHEETKRIRDKLNKKEAVYNF